MSFINSQQQLQSKSNIFSLEKGCFFIPISLSPSITITITMILNLNKANAQKTTQANMMSTQNFLQKNKITVNQVTQSHFTVQGVQMYSSQEIKALKETQQRVRKLQGTPVEVKVYQVAEYFDQFTQGKQLTPKEKVKQALRSKAKMDVKNMSVLGGELLDEDNTKEKPKMTVKERVGQNTNALVRLEKERKKKDAIEQKLAKLSKHYKEYFKGSRGEELNREKQQYNDGQEQYEQEETYRKKDPKKSQLYKSLTKFIKQKDQQQQEEEGGVDSEKEDEQKKAKNKQSNPNFTKKPTTKPYSIASTKATKPISPDKNKNKQKPPKQQNIDQNHYQQDEEFDNEDKKQQQSYGTVSQVRSSKSMRSNKSSYSEKLGTAVFSLFG